MAKFQIPPPPPPVTITRINQMSYDSTHRSQFIENKVKYLLCKGFKMYIIFKYMILV